MPLALSLRKNEDFYVGDVRFFVTAIHTSRSFNLTHCDKDGVRRSFCIDDTKATEIWPNVFASAGEKAQAMIARVVIDAPREMLVIRGDAKRNPPPRFATG